MLRRFRTRHLFGQSYLMPLHKINAHTTRMAGVLVNAEHSLLHSLSLLADPSLSFSYSFVQLILLFVCINHFGFFSLFFFLLNACWCLSVLKKTSRLRILARLFRIFVPFFCVALRLDHVKEERKKADLKFKVFLGLLFNMSSFFFLLHSRFVASDNVAAHQRSQ